MKVCPQCKEEVLTGEYVEHIAIHSSDLTTSLAILQELIELNDK